jgi:hypothetical protein
MEGAFGLDTIAPPQSRHGILRSGVAITMLVGGSGSVIPAPSNLRHEEQRKTLVNLREIWYNMVVTDEWRGVWEMV